MKRIFLFILVVLFSSCKKKLCGVDRYDIGPGYTAIKGQDTFVFFPWKLPPSASANFPKEILDSMEILKQKGYSLKPVTQLHYYYADCECEKIKSYNPFNGCYELP
jgi:hypothetical protein